MESVFLTLAETFANEPTLLVVFVLVYINYRLVGKIIQLLKLINRQDKND